MKLIWQLILPFSMFGVAVSFFTMLAAGRATETVVWTYATMMVALTLANLGREHLRKERQRGRG